MKRLLLPLLAALAFPTASYANLNGIYSAELDGKIDIICDASMRGYLTNEQRDKYLTDSYIKWNDLYVGDKKTRQREMLNTIKWSKKYDYPNCFDVLEKYVDDANI